MDLQTPEGKSRRGLSYQNSPEDFGTSFIRVYENDGTNGPRYIPINSNEIGFFITPQGEVFAQGRGKWGKEFPKLLMEAREELRQE